MCKLLAGVLNIYEAEAEGEFKASVQKGAMDAKRKLEGTECLP